MDNVGIMELKTLVTIWQPPFVMLGNHYVKYLKI